MFDNKRSVWLPKGEPFSGPAFEPHRIQQIVIHYIGTNKAPTDSGNWMLNEHRRTMRSENPYSFMYNAHVALNGVTWEGRGTDFRNAANGSVTNPRTWSIVLAVNGQDPASDAQIVGVRKLIRGIRSYLGRDTPVIPHRQIGKTQCPGDGIVNQINSGIFERSIEVIRISGYNRYETAATISRQLYPNGSTVAYIASGVNFPDALSATMFKDGPLLLTDTNSLPQATRDELVRLKVKKIVIIGGTSAITKNVETALSAIAP